MAYRLKAWVAGHQTCCSPIALNVVQPNVRTTVLFWRLINSLESVNRSHISPTIKAKEEMPMGKWGLALLIICTTIGVEPVVTFSNFTMPIKRQKLRETL